MRVFSKCICRCVCLYHCVFLSHFCSSGHVSSMSVIVIVFLLVRSCLLISLIKCLKGHKSLESLCNVVKALIDSGNRQTELQTMSPIELFWTAKKAIDNIHGATYIFDVILKAIFLFRLASPTLINYIPNIFRNNFVISVSQQVPTYIISI